MDKTSLNFLTSNVHNNSKDQVVLHAICNLVAEPYTPILKGVSAVSISSVACKMLSKTGVTKPTTQDIGTCSLLVQELMETLLMKGTFTKDTLQSEINKLFETVYTGDYINALGPF